MATTTSPPRPSVSVAQDELKEALRTLELATSSKAGANPALGAVRLSADEGGLLLRATDGRFHVSYRIEHSDGGGAGLKATLPLAQLKKALATFDKDDLLVIEPGAAKLELELSRGERKLTLKDPGISGFPIWPATAKRRSAGSTDDPKEFSEALARALICAGRDDVRPILNAIMFDFEEGAVIGTDSYRLAQVDLPTLDHSDGVTEQLMVPFAAARAIAKDTGRRGDPVMLSVYGDNAEGLIVEQGPVCIVAPAQSGQYPNWRTLLEVKTSTSLQVEVKELTAAIKAASAIATTAPSEREPAVLELGQSTRVRLTALDGSRLEERLPSAEYSGTDLAIAFNPGYLADMLRVFPEQKRIRFHFAAETKPVRVEGAGAAGILMPVRRNQIEAPPAKKAQAAKNGKP